MNKLLHSLTGSILAVYLQGACSLFGADYYVSPNGIDSNVGDLSNPLETIQEAFNRAQAGDVIYLRAGVYHEEVDLGGTHGSAGLPVRLLNYPGEEAILDGRVTIDSAWIQHSGNIYSTTVTEDIWQLWVDDQPMTLARWPNSKVWTEGFWDQSQSWAQTDVDGLNHNGWVEDAALTGMTESLVGCVMVMNSFNWKSRASTVSAHTPGEDEFSYSPPLPDYSKNSKKYYFLTGLQLLDTAEEWFYDASNQTLYLWTADGGDPSNYVVSAKNQTYFFDGKQNASHIHFEGLTFWGTTLNMKSCSNISLVDCDFLYPVASKRTLGSITDATPGNFTGADYLEVLNCTFQCSDGRPLVAPNCDYPIVENNLFYQIDYACLATNSNSYTLQLDGSKGAIYRRNEIDLAGASEACRIAGQAYPDGALVEYNYHTRTGLMQTDGASVQYPPGGCTDSINRFNWFINLDCTGFRFDGNPAGSWGNVYRNVAALGSTRGYRLKGDWHEIYNNIGMDAIKDDINIAKDKGPVAYNGESNHNSVTRNNAADNRDLGNNYADSSHYWDGVNFAPSTLREQLRDPDNLDFRPKLGSALIDAGAVVDLLTMKFGASVPTDASINYFGSAPDIGAYEFGDVNYFIPGRIFPFASRPVPPSGTVSAKVDCDLMWLTGADALSHQVYFGTQSGNLGFKSDQTNNIYTPAGVQEGVTYYWRVDTVTNQGVIVGDEWSFTPEIVNPGVNRAPYFFEEDVLSLTMAATGAGYSGDLSSAAVDPDGDLLTYSLVSGPAWLVLAADGSLSGTPVSGDLGLNTCVVRVTDPAGLSDEVEAEVYVVQEVVAAGSMHFGGETGRVSNSVGGANIDMDSLAGYDFMNHGRGNVDWVLFSGSANPAEEKAGANALSNFASPVTVLSNPMIKFSWSDGQGVASGSAIAHGIGNVYGSLGNRTNPYAEYLSFNVAVEPGQDYILRLWLTDQRVATALSVWDQAAQDWSPYISQETVNDAGDLRWHQILIQDVSEVTELQFVLDIKNATNSSKHQLRSLGGVSLEAIPIP